MDDPISDLLEVLRDYFDGLYDGDVEKLAAGETSGSTGSSSCRCRRRPRLTPGVQCAYLPKRFTDDLTFVRTSAGWRIIAKVWHYELDG